MACRRIFTITAENVRRPSSLGKHRQRLLWTMGRLLKADVGKRVFDCGDGVYQVENDDQRNRRLRRRR